MATLKQVEANRRNSLLSTGPMSPAGRAVSCMNALKTGIDAQSEIIPGEDPAELEELTREYYEHYQPQGPGERALISAAITADWRLRRLRRGEAQTFDDEMRDHTNCQLEFRPGVDPHHLQARAYRTADRTLDRCHNRMTTSERDLRTNLEAVYKLRKQAAAPDTKTKPISTFPPQSQEVADYPEPRNLLPTETVPSISASDGGPNGDA